LGSAGTREIVSPRSGIRYAPSINWKHAFFTDEYNHLSLREGIRTSSTPSFAFKHVDMNDLEEKTCASAAQIKIIVTDGVFSQHGDIVPLPDMMRLPTDTTPWCTSTMLTGQACSVRPGLGRRSISGSTAANHSHGNAQQGVRMHRRLCRDRGVPRADSSLRLLGVRLHIDYRRIRPRPCSGDRHGDRRAGAPQHVVGQSTVLRVAHARARACGTVERDSRLCRAHGRRARVRASREWPPRGGFHVDPIMFPAIAPGQSRLRFMMNARHTIAQIDGVIDALAGLMQM
jgi:hypothetical protein